MQMSRRRERLLRAIAPRIDQVIAISADQVPDLVRRGFARDRITVIPNAVSERAVTPSRPRDAVRAELGIRADALVVVAVAALRPEKRLERFAAAVAVAARDQPRLVGLVVGDGVERERLEAEAHGAVRFLGARTDVPDILGAADVFCLTSDAEGVPMAILEAMAAGLPVIATNVGGIGEAVLDGETGMLVDPSRPDALAEAIARLAQDPARARELGMAGALRQRQEFNAARMVDRYERVLTAAVRARSR
jgi:glycosyltransferase involved in cell wall biosynthesis